MSSSIVAVSVCQWRERLLKDTIVWICVVNGDGAVARIRWTTGSFHRFPCFVQGLLQRTGHFRHPSERCPAPLPLFPWTLGMRQTLEKRFNKEQRMAISSSPASPDRGENRLRNLLESETIVWVETNSYSGIGSIWCNNAEDLHYWPIFGLSGSVRGSGSSAASKHLVNVLLLFFVAAFWLVTGCKCGSLDEEMSG